MPIARYQMPDGKVGRFEVPEGTSPEQAEKLIQSEIESQQFASTRGERTREKLAAELKKEAREPIEKTKAFGKAAFESLGGGGGGVAGAIYGGRAGAALGALGGPLAPYTVPAGTVIGGLGGALLGGMGGAEAQKAAGKIVPPQVKEATGFAPEQRKQERRAYPMATLAGELAPAVAPIAPQLFRYGAKAIGRAGEMLGKGREAERASEALKGEVIGGTQRAQTALSQEERALQDRVQQLKYRQQQLSQRDRIVKQRLDMAEGLARRGERMGGTEIDRVVAETRNIKREADSTYKQAEETATTSLEKLSKEKNVIAEDVGKYIQNRGSETVKQLRKTRKEEAITKIKDPAFETAESKEKAGEFLSTNPKSKQYIDAAIKELESQIQGTVEPYRGELLKRLSSLKGEEVKLTPGELRAAQLRASLTGGQPEMVPQTKSQPLTFQQAEFFRRLLNDKALRDASGFGAIDITRTGELSRLIEKAMEEFEPGFAKYLNTYQAKSEPITRALAAGRGAGAVETEKIASGELFSMRPDQVASTYLNGSEAGANELLALTGGKTKELNTLLRGYFRRQMENLTPEATSQFVQKNEGFLRVFPELRQPMQQVSEAKASMVSAKQAQESAQRMVDKASQIASGRKVAAPEIRKGEARAEAAEKRLAGERAGVATQIEKAEERRRAYQTMEDQLSASRGKESIPKAKTIANRLRQDNVIDRNTYQDILSQIEKVEKVYGERAEAKQALMLAMRKLLVYGGAGLGAYGVGTYYGLRAANLPPM